MIKKKTIIILEPKDKNRVIKGLAKLNMNLLDLAKQEHINNGLLYDILNGKRTTNNEFVNMLWTNYHIKLHFTRKETKQ